MNPKIKHFLNWLFHRQSTGLIRDVLDPRDYLITSSVTPVDEMSLSGCFPPVKYQNGYNACTAYAVCALIDYIAQYKKQLAAWKDLEASEAFQWWFARQDLGVSGNAGTSLRLNFKTWAKHGAVPETEWDFTKGWNTLPSDRAQNIGKAFLLYEPQFGGYFSIPCLIGADLNLMRQVLTEGYPIVFAIEVTQKFADLRKHNLFDDMTGASLGYHALLITGFGPGYFEIRNSWGPNWGNNGWAKVSEEIIQTGAFDLWTLK